MCIILQCHNCALVMALPSSVRHYVGTLPVHKFDFLTELRSSLIELQYALVHCTFVINIVIETRKNGQPTSVWKKDFDKLWSPSKFRNSFFKVKISKFNLEYPFTLTTSKKALPNILKIASNHRISSRQGLIRSINPWWASKLIQIFLPDTCEPPSKKVYILCLTNVLTLSPPPKLQSWMKSEGADNSTLLWLDIWYLNDISMLTSRVNLSNW